MAVHVTVYLDEPVADALQQFMAEYECTPTMALARLLGVYRALAQRTRPAVVRPATIASSESAPGVLP